MGILIIVLTVFLVLLSCLLIAVVMMQTPKSEGFGSGAANVQGGGFRGKAGYDEMLSNYTRFIAIGWFAIAFLLALASEYVRRQA